MIAEQSRTRTDNQTMTVIRGRIGEVGGFDEEKAR
jgi:hypothetical protein